MEWKKMWQIGEKFNYKYYYAFKKFLHKPELWSHVKLSENFQIMQFQQFS